MDHAQEVTPLKPARRIAKQVLKSRIDLVEVSVKAGNAQRIHRDIEEAGKLVRHCRQLYIRSLSCRDVLDGSQHIGMGAIARKLATADADPDLAISRGTRPDLHDEGYAGLQAAAAGVNELAALGLGKEFAKAFVGRHKLVVKLENVARFTRHMAEAGNVIELPPADTGNISHIRKEDWSRLARQLKLATGRDIHPHGEIALGDTIMAQYGNDRCIDPEKRPVLGLVAHLRAPRLAAGNDTPHVGKIGSRMMSRRKHRMRVSDQLTARVSALFAKMVVDVGDVSIGIRDGKDQLLLERLPAGGKSPYGLPCITLRLVGLVLQAALAGHILQ